MRKGIKAHASKDAFVAAALAAECPGPADSRPRLVIRPGGWLTVVGFVNAEQLIDDEIVSEFGAQLVGLVEAGHRDVVINLEGVDQVSSYLVAHLAWLHRKISKAGGVFRICCPDPMVYRVFSLCGLDQIFEIYDSEAVALAGGKPARA